MEQSQKDAAIKVAWISGGLTLAGTLITAITLLFTNDPATKDPPPPPAMTSISPAVPPSPPPSTEPTTPTSLVPGEVVGNWYGGPAGQANLRLRITESADYVFWDVAVPNSPVSGKIGVKGAIIELYGNDGIVYKYPWSVEETPRGDVLHLGVYHYLRE